jgi:hypothetical protein
MGAVRFTDRQPETDAPMRSAGRPFFHILTDNGIAVRFLEAVAADPEEAMAFVSKHSAGAIDMEALRDILGTAGRLCNSWVQISYNNNPKNCLTRSVLLVDKERNTKQLLHLHMVREPDRYGQWKIYGVEKE